MLLSRVLVILLLLINSDAFAGSVDVNMSSTAARFEGGYSADGNAEFQTGLLYDDQGSVLIDSGLMMKGGGEQDAASGLAVGGGVKAVAAHIQQGGVTDSAFCIALGGQGAFTPPAIPLITLVGEFLTSLQITTFGDANRFSQFSARLEMGPPHAKFYFGYRENTFSITGSSNVSVGKGSFVGVAFTF